MTANNKDYKELLEQNDCIMMDTCFAMRDEFPEFVNEIEMELLVHKKKIIVKSVVMAELYKLMASSDDKVRERATRAVDIICMNRNLFNTDERIAGSCSILKAFADVEFLTDFTKNRLKYRMVLLTNDFKLGRDITDLNLIESCNGKKVEAYFINKYGRLEEHKHKEASEEPKTEKALEVLNDTCKKKNAEWGKIVLISAASVTAGVFLDKYWKQAINTIMRHVA